MDSYQVDPDVVGGNGDGDGWANAHPSLADWDADNAQDLTSLADSLEAECRGVTNKDTTKLVIGSDWESSATYFVQVRATTGHIAKKDGWDDTIYGLVVTDDRCFECSPWSGATHVKLIGLQIRRVYDSVTYSECVKFGGGLSAGDTMDIDGCRIECDQNTLIALRLDDTDGTMYVYNSIIGGKDSIDNARYGGYLSAGTMYAYNCCFINSGTTGYYVAGGTGIIKNSILAGNGDDVDNAGTITVQYNCAEDDLDTEFTETTNVQPDGGNIDNEIVDVDNGDCTLVAGGNAENAGVDDPSSGRYSVDMEGDSYTSIWSMGVDEPVAVGGNAPTGVLDGCLGGCLAGPI